MTEWGPWINNRVPEVGMYIQVETKHAITGEMRMHEGIVAGFKDNVCWFVGEFGPLGYSEWMAKRWRELIYKDIPPVAIHKERVLS